MPLDTFPFNEYANALSLALFQTNEIIVNNYVSPDAISNLQALIVSLPVLDTCDFPTILASLTEISNTYALWASSGLPSDSSVVLSIYEFNLGNLKNSLCVSYIQSAAECGLTFTKEQVNFILYDVAQPVVN